MRINSPLAQKAEGGGGYGVSAGPSMILASLGGSEKKKKKKKK